jgi:predicted ATPase/DNA-binding SARP family transcriptional activator
MRFRVLGAIEVEADGGPVPIVGHRLRALLSALLLQPNEVVGTDRLVDSIWGADLPDVPTNALQQVVTRLRSRLGNGAECLTTAPGGYRILVAPGQLDADAFETSYRQARQLADVDPESALKEIESALGWWRGPAYGEFATGFAQAASVRLDELRAAAAEDRVELLLRTGAEGTAVAAARELVGTAPLRERPVELLMRALHASGRVADALAVYRAHRELLAEELGLDPPATLRDLEARILNDDAPVVAAAPPARPAPPGIPRSELPGRPGTIIGRDDDLALVRDQLATRPLVSIVGPGGVGKTRLALELAHEAALAGEPVVWVDLSAVEPGRSADLVAEAAGVDMPRGPDPHSALGASLGASSVLLCLDNAETVLDGLAPLVEALLEHAPRMRILATSRERLAVHSEHVHRLAPLAVPTGPDAHNPAVQLFLARASGLAEPMTESALEDIALLCRRLDGLPLALELGAAQAPTFGVREFSEHVAEELDLLAGGRRTAAARHRALRAVIDASYHLLTPDEATLCARLAVFPGRFGLEDARSVCAGEPIDAKAVGPVLARLAEQSLVQSAGGRFWLLDTLRTYARERIGDDELLRLRGRHARHVADRVVALQWQQRPETEAACVEQLNTMSPDLHAAWAYAAEHDRSLAVELAAAMYDFAYLRQRLDLLDWGRQVAEWDVSHPDLSQALAVGAAGAWAAGDLAAAEGLALRGLSLDDGTGRPSRARSMSQAGNLAMFAGDFDEAVRRYEECVSLNLAEGRPIAALIAEIAICQATTYAGRAEQVLDRLADLRRRARRTGNPSALAWASFVTGEAIGDSDVPAALAAYRRAMEAALEVDNRLFLGLARSSAVVLAGRHGTADAALAEFGRVLDEWDELGNIAAQWWVLMNFAILFTRLGEDRPAALLAGAFLGIEGRTYMLLGDEERLQNAVTELSARLGETVAETTFAEGGELSVADAVALARETMDRLTADEPRTDSGTG